MSDCFLEEQGQVWISFKTFLQLVQPCDVRVASTSLANRFSMLENTIERTFNSKIAYLNFFFLFCKKKSHMDEFSSFFGANFFTEKQTFF